MRSKSATTKENKTHKKQIAKKTNKVDLKFINWIKRNKVIITIFIISTIYFFIQHSTTISWDFSAYVLNAKYFLMQGTYFEPFRPPLAAMIIGALSVFGWLVAEYLFIIISSALFAYSSTKLAKNLKINKNIFYALSFTAYAFIFGTFAGTELLTSALLILAIAYTLEKKPLAGLMLGIGMLLRYQMAMFLPILLLDFNKKRFIQNIILFIIPIAAWLAYNFFKYGNMFTSIADQYALNILYRNYLTTPPQFEHFLTIIGILFPLMIIGIIYVINKIVRGKSRLKNELTKPTLIMLFIILIAIYGYISSPIKDARYLFIAIIPAAYFSTILFEMIKQKAGQNAKVIVTIIVALIFITNLGIATQSTNYFEHNETKLNHAMNEVKKLGGENCKVLSTSWVLLNYLGLKTGPAPQKPNIQRELDKGTIILIFPSDGDPKYTKDINYLQSLPVKVKTNDYCIIYNGGCAPKERLDKTYLEMLNKEVKEMYNYEIETNPCKVLFEKNKTIQDICLFINGQK